MPQDLPLVHAVDLLVSDLDGDGFLDIYLVSAADHVAPATPMTVCSAGVSNLSTRSRI